MVAPPVVRVGRALAGRRYGGWARPEVPVRPVAITYVVAAFVGLVTYGIVNLIDAGDGLIFAILDLPQVLGLVAGLGTLWALGRRRERTLAEALGREGDEAAAIAHYALAEGDSTVALGRDEGMLSSVDGWLHFRGLRTEWSLAPGDTIRRQAHVEIPMGEGRRATVFFTPPAGGIGRATDLRTVLDDWDAGPDPVGEPVFPPITPNGPWPVRWDPEIGSFVGVAALGLMIGGGAAVFDFPWLLIPVILGIVGGIVRLVRRARERAALVRRVSSLPEGP